MPPFRFIKQAASLAQNLCAAGPTAMMSDPAGSGFSGWKHLTLHFLRTRSDCCGREPDPLSNSGYVVHTLQTALYEAFTADEASEAIVGAVNRGGDTDTLGVVAGARFGASELPAAWIDAIDKADEFRNPARDLFEGTYTPVSV
jgi:hypothetical protein